MRSAGHRSWRSVVAAAAGLACLLSAGCREPGAEPGVPQACGGDEGRDRAAWERARKEKERLDLRAEVDTLAASLARVEAARDRAQVEPDVEPDAARAEVRSFDPRWGWVVLDGGAAAGMRRGQVYGVYRNDIWVARVRVEDVRAQVAGAWVEEVRSGWTPAPGDRAVREQRER